MRDSHGGVQDGRRRRQETWTSCRPCEKRGRCIRSNSASCSRSGADMPDVGDESAVRTAREAWVSCPPPRYRISSHRSQPAQSWGSWVPLSPSRLLKIVHCEFLGRGKRQRMSQSGLLARPPSTGSPLGWRRLPRQLGKDGSPAPARWSLAPQKGHRPGARARGPIASSYAIRRH